MPTLWEKGRSKGVDMRATVKEFLDGLNEMRNIYPFDDDRTIMGTENPMSRSENRLSIHTVDKETDIIITMEKQIGDSWQDCLSKKE